MRRKESTVEFGKKGEYDVYNILTQRGLEVHKTLAKAPFDLLANGYALDVKMATRKPDGNWDFVIAPARKGVERKVELADYYVFVLRNLERSKSGYMLVKAPLRVRAKCVSMPAMLRGEWAQAFKDWEDFPTWRRNEAKNCKDYMPEMQAYLGTFRRKSEMLPKMQELFVAYTQKGRAELARALVAYRTVHGLTQRQLSKLCGVADRTIGLLENGGITTPQVLYKVYSVLVSSKVDVGEMK